MVSHTIQNTIPVTFPALLAPLNLFNRGAHAALKISLRRNSAYCTCYLATIREAGIESAPASSTIGDSN